MIKQKFEKIYGEFIKIIFISINPIKKKIVKTYCTVHKYINMMAMNILKNENYIEEYEFIKKHIKCINEGVTWADSDFKSSNHFYHVKSGKGLYGFSNALSEMKKYYNMALEKYKAGDTENSLCYLGAACHLIQDATVPHHVNKDLLNHHRKFELWIMSKILSDYSFDATNGIIKYDNIDDYVKKNAESSYEIFEKYKNIKDVQKRYESMSTEILKIAQMSTAGLLLQFCNDIKNSFTK